MSASSNPRIDLDVSRGVGLDLKINDTQVDDPYGAIVMAEQLRSRQRPTPAVMARMIADEVARNEIWD
jgi:hypothetical protein